MNIWKITSIIFIVMIFGLSLNLYSNSNETYDFENFEIKKSTLDNIAEEIGEFFVICDIDTNNCLSFGKLK